MDCSSCILKDLVLGHSHYNKKALVYSHWGCEKYCAQLIWEHSVRSNSLAAFGSRVLIRKWKQKEKGEG